MLTMNFNDTVIVTRQVIRIIIALEFEKVFFNRISMCLNFTYIGPIRAIQQNN